MVYIMYSQMSEMSVMREMYQAQDDEMDLCELFQTLWDGKWLISAFIAIAMLLGGGFLSLKEAAYESKLIYSVDIIPPFYNADKASSDFQKKFYSLAYLRNGNRIIVMRL